jgi:hypothetical protein
MSDFRNHVCWDPARVAQVMADGVAERIDSSDRAATHFPLPMRRVRMRVAKDGQWTQEEGEAATAEQVLDEFLNNPSGSLAAAILGDAGTGKTHLLKWVHAHLPQRDDTKVIVIPRKDVGLPGVVALLVEGLPGKHFEDIRGNLAQAGAHMTPALAKELVATTLAAYVRQGQDPIGQSDEERDRVQSYLRPRLPDLLLDRAFINYLTDSHGPFAAIGDHLMRWAGGLAKENPMSFDAALLCRPVRGLQRNAEEIAVQLRDGRELAPLAAQLCNHELRRAIQGQIAQGVMSNLGQLLEDVRKAYAALGKKIILLFEDLARAQFIDEELVLACVGDQRPDGPKLAPMRTLFACTTGMFRQLRDTVIQRIRGPVVTLDEGDSTRDRNVPRGVAARYLNAVRTPESAVQGWFNTPVQQREPLASACGQCQHREPCHRAFGEHEGVGLYPFNATALDRLTSARGGERFVARQFVTRVLYENLTSATKAIPARQHPATDFLRNVPKAPPSLINVGPRVAPSEPDRWERIYRVYGSDSEVPEEAVSREVADAFDLAVVDLSKRKTGTTTKTVINRDPTTEQEKRLMEWSDGQSKLLQSDVTNMRARLRSLVLGNIAANLGGWGDDVVESLLPPKSINFYRMDIASDADQVNVPVVLPETDTMKACRKVVLLFLAAENMYAGLGADDPEYLWSKVSPDDYLELATFAHGVGERVEAMAAGALGGRRQAARFAMAGAAWARIERDLPVDGRRADSLAASVLAQDTSRDELEALLAAVGFQKVVGARSTMVDGALLHDAADYVLRQPLVGLATVSAPREPGTKALLGDMVRRAKKATDRAKAMRSEATEDLLEAFASIQKHAGGLPNQAERQQIAAACKDLLDTVSSVKPWDHRRSQELRGSIEGFLKCGIDTAAYEVESANKAPSDIAALIGLCDPGLHSRVETGLWFLDEAGALVAYAEELERVMRDKELSRSGGVTLASARDATLTACAGLRHAMAIIEDGESHVA